MNPTITSDGTMLDLPALAGRFAAAARALFPEGEANVTFEPPRRAEHGDVATNVAFALAKVAKKKPLDIANAIIERALEDAGVRATVAEATAAAGFINLRLVPQFWRRTIASVLREGPAYGRGATQNERISLEFGSANPTGPLVVVQGRTLSIGDTLAKTLRFAGYDVFTEWIINDAGSQFDQLARSLYARYMQLWDAAFPFPEEGYPGDYVPPIAERIREIDGERWRNAPESEWWTYFGTFGRDEIVREQQAVAARFGVTYDLWQSEKALHDAGAIATGIDRLRTYGLTYEADGALWLRTTESGDNEDRVVVRSDGRPAYFANDIAYHYDKLQRADRVIDILGPDHHGYIARLRALADAYGRNGAIEVLIAQQITLKRGAEIVSMSKRHGDIVTLAEIIDEVGVDAARFFLLARSHDTTVDLDLDLAVSESADNPVYYVQYAHARIASILQRAGEDRVAAACAQLAPVEPLHASERALIQRLLAFPAELAEATERRAPHRVASYALELAQEFTAFYRDCHVLGVEPAATESLRLALSFSAREVIARALWLLGVSAPSQM